jgi:hypothetical protein
MKSSFHGLIPSLLLLSDQVNSSAAPKFISRQGGVPKLDSSCYSMLLITSLQLLRTDQAENKDSNFKEAYLLIRCLAMDFILLRALVLAIV